MVTSPPKLVRSVPPPEPAPRARSFRTRKRHQQTVIGAIFRSKRLDLGLSQVGIGSLININYNRVSNIELGDCVPTDDELLAFAERFQVDLDSLLQARDAGCDFTVTAGDQLEPQSSPHAIIPLAEEASLTPEPSSPIASSVSAPQPDELDALLELSEQIQELVPQPTDSELRSQWRQAVRLLYAVRKAKNQ